LLVLVTSKAELELLAVPENGSVNPPPPPPVLAMVSVDPLGVMVTFDPAASVRLSRKPFTDRTT
jgi:hypothetical protein